MLFKPRSFRYSDITFNRMVDIITFPKDLNIGVFKEVPTPPPENTHTDSQSPVKASSLKTLHFTRYWVTLFPFTSPLVRTASILHWTQTVFAI